MSCRDRFMRERLVRSLMSDLDSLVGRAVEAAAQAEFDRLATCHGGWDRFAETERERYRSKVRPHVLVALGVVADHCTTEADAINESTSAPGISPANYMHRGGQISAFRSVAAELRETP